MASTKKTVQEAIEIHGLINNIEFEDFRLKYAISKNIRSFKKVLKKYQTDAFEIELDLAQEVNGLVEEKPREEGGGFNFTKANRKIMVSKKDALMKANVEVEVYMLPIVAEMLSLHASIIGDLEDLLPKDFEDKLAKIQAEEKKKKKSKEK